MAQLTKSAVMRITQALDEAYFSSACFNLTFPEGGEVYVDARFIDNRDFFFNIRKSKRYNAEFAVTYSPGTVTLIQEYSTDDFDSCCTSLKRWSGNIRNELVASSPVYIEFEQFKTKLNEEIGRRFTDSGEHFTRDEIEGVRSKLDELEKRMEELHKKNDLTENELAEIKNALSALKEDAESMPKKPWYRAAGNKVANLMTRFVTSKAGQKLIEDGARKLLDIPRE